MRRRILSKRGADVRGLDAFIEWLSADPVGELGFFAIETEDANLVGFFEGEKRALIGWIAVPLDLPPLPDLA